MTVLGIRYLSGYAAAMDLPLQKSEWPVHPGRVFLAMVAAHYESGAAPEERVALEWLESQTPPAMRAGIGHARSNYNAYVPVNDGKNAALDRSRQERTFSKVWLENDTAYLAWEATASEQVRRSLVCLTSKVTRIGHSASMVQMWLEAGSAEIVVNWIPDDRSPLRFRVPEQGTLANCDADFNAPAFLRYFAISSQLETAKGKEKKLLQIQKTSEFPKGLPEYRRPSLNRWQGYSPKSDCLASTTFPTQRQLYFPTDDN